MRIGNILKEAGLAASSSEANRKVDEKAVKVDGTRVTDRGLIFNAGADHVFQVGSHRFARVKLLAETFVLAVPCGAWLMQGLQDPPVQLLKHPEQRGLKRI